MLEQPASAETIPVALSALRDVASRLQAQTREVTRHVNQLHNLLARVFGEFATIVPQRSAKSILELLQKSPTPAQIARARLSSIEAIPKVRSQTARQVHDASKTTIASRAGPVAETRVRTLVGPIRFAQKLKFQYARLLVETDRSLPTTNHLDSITGIGEVTAAVLTAKSISSDRLDRPEQRGGYFGLFPEENSSGMGPDGLPHPRRNTRRSKRGDDLVRHYLFNASLSASQHNPAVRPL